MVIEINTKPEQLNGFLGDLLTTFITPSGSQNSASEVEILNNEIYYRDQEIKKLKSTQNIAIAVAGLCGVTAAYFGYKSSKK
ncbi:hypothetical protein JJL45_09205 [Tamlana sp. s12]|uniref:hypothetical protein n=1 Tax=Tamlana sp. s12 TaxID=1630406 RepID=UPI000800178B|nr:hypothetical protein [Tamlana sp. s12]OBQ52867.1 hypothetical protein VQ01_13040 [Tamlana sp. s12]QQY81107.1 hypothetical protein JJL45_09205 [Tamlana sp. s12]